MEIITLSVGELATNCYIVYHPDRKDCIVIDPGDDAKKILSAIGNKEVAAVLLTHGHFDHTGALDAFSCPVYMHPADEPMLHDGEEASVFPNMAFSPRHAQVEYVMEGAERSLAGLSIYVLHTPGHSPGSVCYQVEDSLFTGDTLFHRGYGRTDLKGGNFSQLVMSLRRLYRQPAQMPFYPGHGESSTIAKERGR